MFGKKQKQPYLSLPLGYTKENKVFSLTDTDAEKHIWCQGTSGSGKSWAVCWIILTLLRNKRNFIAIDPHGDLVSDLLSFIPEQRSQEVIYVNPADQDFSIGFNILGFRR